MKILIIAETSVQSLVFDVKMLVLAKTFNRNRGSKSENVDFS